jgi:type IV pilus assembly protein PilM
MLRLTRSQVQPIGLDLGADSVKMIQLEVVEDTLSVIAAARQTLPDDARWQPDLRVAVSMDLVRQMLRNHPFVGRNVVAGLPREIVQVKNLRLPMMPSSELEPAVQFEARNIFPLDPDHAVVRYLPAGEVRQGADTRLEVIALAAQQNDINGYLEQLHRCGCVIESLDFEPCAIYRSIERFIRRKEDENDVHVLVDMGARRSQVIIGRGREISFYKAVDIGANNLHDAVSRKLEISLDEARSLRRRLNESVEPADPARPDAVRQAVSDATRPTIEELAREISLCLRYYSVTFRGQRPGRVRLLGGEAGDPHLLGILSAALPIPIEAGKPLLSVNTSTMKQGDRRGYMSEWAAAFGLSLKMTTQYFGARDGRRRDPATAEKAVLRGDATPTSNVEVADVAQVLDSSNDASRGPAQEATNA